MNNEIQRYVFTSHRGHNGFSENTVTFTKLSDVGWCLFSSEYTHYDHNHARLLV